MTTPSSPATPPAERAPPDAHRVTWEVSAASPLPGKPEFIIRGAAGKEAVFPGHRFGEAGWRRMVSTALDTPGSPDRQIEPGLLSELRAGSCACRSASWRSVSAERGRPAGEAFAGPVAVACGTPRDARLSRRFWGVNEAGHDDPPSVPCHALIVKPCRHTVTTLVRYGWKRPVAQWAEQSITVTEDPRSGLQRIPIPVTRGAPTPPRRSSRWTGNPFRSPDGT